MDTTYTKTPGEILPHSIEKLLSFLSLSAQDVFIDLGSGHGKIVGQVFLQSKVKESWGIEIIPEYHYEANLLAQKMRQDFPANFENDRKLHFMEGNFLEIKLPNPTVVLINAACFSQAMLKPLGLILNQLKSVHTVLTLRPISTLTRLTLKKRIRVECSWDSALCYVYSHVSN